MPTVYVEKIKPGDFIRHEITGLSRDAKTVLSGQVLKCGQPCATNSAGKMIGVTGGVSEIHTLTPSAAATAGTWALRLWHKDGYWVQTAAMAYNANTTAVAAAINAVLGTSAVACGGTVFSGGTGGLTITYSGTGYTLLQQPFPQAVLDNLIGPGYVTPTRSTPAGGAGETQLLAIGGTVSGGTFKLGIRLPNGGGMVWTDTIAHNATFATVISAANTALDDVLGAGMVVASGSAYTAITLTFSGAGFAGNTFPVASVDVAALTGATTASVYKVGSVDAICLLDTDASGGDVANVPFLVRHAWVDLDKLYFGGANPTLVAAQLQAVGIVCRAEGVNRLIGV